jgi:hypothetical protein
MTLSSQTVCRWVLDDAAEDGCGVARRMLRGQRTQSLVPNFGISIYESYLLDSGLVIVPVQQSSMSQSRSQSHAHVHGVDVSTWPDVCNFSKKNFQNGLVKHLLQIIDAFDVQLHN